MRFHREHCGDSAAATGTSMPGFFLFFHWASWSRAVCMAQLQLKSREYLGLAGSNAFTCCYQYLGVAFQKEIIITQCDLDRKGYNFWGGKKSVENFTADGGKGLLKGTKYKTRKTWLLRWNVYQGGCQQCFSSLYTCSTLPIKWWSLWYPLLELGDWLTWFDQQNWYVMLWLLGLSLKSL